MTPRVTNMPGEAFAEVCGRYGTALDAYETDRDHAHLLVSYPPKVALSKLVMSLKTISSMWVRERHWPEVARALWGEHFWHRSSCVVSAGRVPLGVVKRYIENHQSPRQGMPPRSGRL